MTLLIMTLVLLSCATLSLVQSQIIYEAAEADRLCSWTKWKCDEPRSTDKKQKCHIKRELICVDDYGRKNVKETQREYKYELVQSWNNKLKVKCKGDVDNCIGSNSIVQYKSDSSQWCPWTNWEPDLSANNRLSLVDYAEQTGYALPPNTTELKYFKRVRSCTCPYNSGSVCPPKDKSVDYRANTTWAKLQNHCILSKWTNWKPSCKAKEVLNQTRLRSCESNCTFNNNNNPLPADQNATTMAANICNQFNTEAAREYKCNELTEFQKIVLLIIVLIAAAIAGICGAVYGLKEKLAEFLK